jgi:arylsulfatase
MSRVENAKRGNTNYRFEYVLYEQDRVIEVEPPQTELTQKVTAAAVGFIESNPDSPFFLYVAHPMPHIPIYASADFRGRSARGDYGDTVEELDWSVGRIMETLRRQGLDKNTLVVFTSDNGPWLTQHQRGGSAGPLKDGKGSTFEGGFRVPCIMWGSMVSPGHITDMGGTLDLLPTFCEMAGVALPTDRVYDGVSQLDVIRDKSPGRRETNYFYRGSDLFAMRAGQYKIHFIYQPAYGRDPKKVLDTPMLYDLGVDPSEIYDIAADHPEIVERLTAMAREHRASFTIAESVFDKQP